MERSTLKLFQNGQNKLRKYGLIFHLSHKQPWFQVKGFSWNWILLNWITLIASIPNFIEISQAKLKIIDRTSFMLLSNKEWLSLRWFRRKSYLVDNSFENNYIDFHENLTKGAVPNTKSQTQGRTDGRDLHIKLISYFVKDASRLNLLLFQNTDLQQFIYMQSNKIHEVF